MQRPRHIAFSDVMLNCHYEEDSGVRWRYMTHPFLCLFGKWRYMKTGALSDYTRGNALLSAKTIACRVKRPMNGEPYHATVYVWHVVSCRIYRQLNTAELPDKVRTEQEKPARFYAPDRPDIVSLFESIKPYYYSDDSPSDEWNQLENGRGGVCPANTDKNLYASLFDFVEPWKIDILEFLDRNYMWSFIGNGVFHWTKSGDIQAGFCQS